MYVEIALIVAGWQAHNVFSATLTRQTYYRIAYRKIDSTERTRAGGRTKTVFFIRRPKCFAARTSGRMGDGREWSTIEKCKHKNKLDVTRSAKRRRREIESFKNEHRKIYLGEKPMGNTQVRQDFRWTESMPCYGLFALKRARAFITIISTFHLQLKMSVALRTNYSETIWIYLFCRSFWCFFLFSLSLSIFCGCMRLSPIVYGIWIRVDTNGMKLS